MSTDVWTVDAGAATVAGRFRPGPEQTSPTPGAAL